MDQETGSVHVGRVVHRAGQEDHVSALSLLARRTSEVAKIDPVGDDHRVDPRIEATEDGGVVLAHYHNGIGGGVGPALEPAHPCCLPGLGHRCTQRSASRAPALQLRCQASRVASTVGQRTAAAVSAAQPGSTWTTSGRHRWATAMAVSASPAAHLLHEEGPPGRQGQELVTQAAPPV